MVLVTSHQEVTQQPVFGVVPGKVTGSMVARGFSVTAPSLAVHSVSIGPPEQISVTKIYGLITRNQELNRTRMRSVLCAW